MRILTIIDHLGPGGRQRTAQNYTLGYVDAGCEVAVMTVFGGGARETNLQQHGVQLFIGAVDPRERARAIAGAAAWRPDAIHFHSEGPPRAVVAEAVEALLARLPSRPPVLETSSFGKVEYSQRFTFSDVYLLKARWALWKWQSWSRPLRPRPLGVVIPNTTDTDAFYPVSAAERSAFRSEHGISEDAFLMGRVGQPIIWKWDPIIFDAFENVANRHGRAHLLLVGLPEELRPRLDALDAAVRARITEIPFLRDDDALRTCYGALDVFLHAARIGESFGMVLTEAMACECPVITLSTPARDNSQVEVVGHERGGLVVHDREGMSAAIERLMADASLRARLGRDGSAHVRATYTLEQVIPKLLRLIEHARSAPSRQNLAQRLASEPDFVTAVNDEEIRHLLHSGLGHPPLRQRALMRLVHVPLLFRLWWMIKGLRYRRRETLPFGLAPHNEYAPSSVSAAPSETV